MKRSIVFNTLLLLVMLLGLAGYPQEVSIAQEITTSTAADVLGVAAGVHLQPSETFGSDLQAFNTQVGKNAAILMYFTNFYYGFDPFLFKVLTQNLSASEKPALMLTLLPYDGRKAKGCDKDYNGFIGYDAMLSGKCDQFIRDFATAIAEETGTRFLIRFAHEMNIPESDYWPGHSGRGADAYVQMYRHIYQVFMAAQDATGQRNAEFVWSPNYFSQPAEPWNYYYNYYPGDQYVDWIGLSGYNWYPYNREPDRSFKQIFGDLDGTDAYYSDAGFHPGTLYDLSCRYAKPIILAEFAAAHNSGTAQQKVDWITDAYNKMPTHPFVRAVVWFNDYAYATTDIDFRVTGVSSEITNAYKTAVQRSQYRSTLPSLEDATPPSTYCWTDPGKGGQAVYNLSRSGALTRRSTQVNLSVYGMLITGDPSVSFSGLPSGVSASVVQDDLSAPWGKADLRFTIGSNTPYGSYPVAVKVNSQQGVIDLRFDLSVVDRLYQTRLPLVTR